MNKVVSRLLVFFIGIPLILAIVYLPYCNHLALHILVCLVSVIASCELYDMLSKNMALPPKPFIAFLSALIPFVQMLISVIPGLTGGQFSVDLPTCVLIFSLLAVLVYEVFSAKTFEFSNQHFSGSFFIIIYAGYLITFLQRLTTATSKEGESMAVPLITTLLLMVFLCDSLAWLFGVLFGKNNRGFIKASPNKSIAGFIGGLIGSVAAGVLASFVWPDFFGSSRPLVIVTGVLTAFAAIIGDLIESICKRSSGVKDSGSIIPGRGGLLDSIDSILLASPLFYLLTGIFFGPFGA